ncbi:MAG TPA: 3-phosphoshikimate 1-carboxyvinyltransferase [Thermoleophilaceae bacterium]|nr:3-phosphoshikimate 1-carboxyvinyltransferase [Thermoleophilaceae bacterium]
MSAGGSFEPSGAVRGTYRPPADKSISHRAALFGAMSDVPVTVRNYLDSADTGSTLDALLGIGAGITQDGDDLVVRGVGLHAALEATGGRLDVGNSGTLLRLIPGWLAGQPGGEWTLDGDESIRRRPVDRVVEPLALMGAGVAAREGRYPPLTVRGAELHGIEYPAPVASAQVKSCVLIAGMLADGTTTLTEPRQSRDHTERILQRSRVPLERDGLTVTVTQVDELELDEITVPGDPSSAAFIVAAACLVPGSRVVIADVGLNWTRTGFLRIAQRMGAVILGDLEEPGTVSSEEPVGELDVAHGPLDGTEVGPDEVPTSIDELTLVALLGAFAEGETTVRGAAELRHKESDRISGVVDGLRGIGADIEETADGFSVRGNGARLEGGTRDARGDHRLAMLGAVAGLASRKGVQVVGMEASAISYPAFEQDLAALLRG